eukprot:2993433-Prymnesium_polylepis.1
MWGHRPTSGRMWKRLRRFRSRGCTSAVDANGCCMAGGRSRSHDFPDGLESIGLEALDTTA